jgi:hypothetical protein
MEKNYIEYLNLPPIPQKFVDEILLGFQLTKKYLPTRLAASEYENDVNYDNSFCYTKREDILKSLELNNLREEDCALFHEYNNPLPKKMDEWIKENIMPDGIAKVFILGFGKILLPHRDRRINEAYNYVLLKGGNVKNKFWKPKKEYENIKIPQTIYVPYEKIDCVAEYEIPQYKWHKFDPSEVHSVENINPSEFRIIVSVDNQIQKPVNYTDFKKNKH